MAKRPKNIKKLTPKQRFSRHYYAFMPNKKHHRVLVWVVFFLVAGAIALQMLYPVNRALPFARLGEVAVGWQTDVELESAINQKFTDTRVVLVAPAKQTGEYLLSSAGAEPEASAMVAGLLDYPLWQRFIPGSLLFKRPVIKSWQLTFTGRPLAEFSEQVAKELSYPAINASLAIEDGRLVATNEQPGSNATAEQVKNALITAQFNYNGLVSVSVNATSLPPAKTASDLVDVKTQAELALARPVQIQANGTTFTPDQVQKATWLQLATDEHGATILSINAQAINNYLDETVTKQAGKPAGVTQVVIQNGYETSRTEGEVGLKVNNEPLVQLIGDYLLKKVGRSPFIAEMVPVAPTVVYNNSYSATKEGLQAYISEKAKRGTWISIEQLDGERWVVGADDTDSVVSGSTYKLFVALYLFKEMDEGKINWGTPILDTNTSTCFDRMTIASTNPCAEEWLRQFGRSNVNEYIYSKGFSRATTFTHPEATHTSARDLTKFMIGLEQGTLISGAHRDRLLQSLSRHPYRYGIPAGSKGRVWDKVGFVWNYVNDTAIVHHPRGKYVMTILTEGKSYAAIASMTREIEKIMYP